MSHIEAFYSYGIVADESCYSICRLFWNWCAVGTPTMFIVSGLYSRIKILPLHPSVPPVRSVCHPTNREVIQLSKDRGGCRSVDPDMENNQTSALNLWISELIWYLYTRGERGRMNAKWRWFKMGRGHCLHRQSWQHSQPNPSAGFVRYTWASAYRHQPRFLTNQSWPG